MNTKVVWLVPAVLAVLAVIVIVIFVMNSVPTQNPTGTGSQTVGASLYAQNCQGCHGPLATSAKHGRTASQIQNAINAVGSMNSRLSNLTPAEIQEIANALSEP
jgi:mono/diheme cytochrome c family protein